jgi:hypothetical protein
VSSEPTFTPRPAVVLAGFLLLSIAWTWPVAANLTSRIPHDAGDPVLNIWILWWNAQAIPLTDRWWNPPIMWPMPGAMALSEHLLGQSLLATPMQLAGASTITAYNVCLLLSYALSGFFAYLLGRRLTGSTIAGICGGIAFGFSPYRSDQLSHLQVLSSQWMPLALLGLHAYLTTGARRWLVLFGTAWLVQALSNGYFLLFVPVLFVAWLAWFIDWRRAPGRGLSILAAWVLASLPLLPVLLKYREVHGALGLTRTLSEIRDFSAEPASFRYATPLLRFWPEGPSDNPEQDLFTGVTIVLIAVVGLVLRVVTRARVPNDVGRAPIFFYAAATLLMCALSLGPGGEAQEPASPLFPYTWLLWLPGFNGLRVPSRFWMVGTLCLAMTATLAIGHIAKLRLFTGRKGLLWGIPIAVGLLADGMTYPIPLAAPPGKIILPGSEQVTVIELPADNAEVSRRAMYRSIFHQRPLINGYSGHTPPHYEVLTESLGRGDFSGLLYFARLRPLVIIVNDLFDPGRGYRKMVEEIPGIQPQGITAGGSTFLLPAQAAPRVPPVGLPLNVVRVRDTGRYLMEFDLGDVRNLGAIDFPLRNRYADFASRLRIEVSEDGRTWREAWSGWTGGLAVEATLADPLLAPIRIALPGERGRYVRVYPASGWMKEEIVVRGE